MITKKEQNMINKISKLRMELIAKLTEIETQKEQLNYFNPDKRRITSHICRLKQQQNNIEKKIEINERKLYQYRREIYINNRKKQLA